MIAPAPGVRDRALIVEGVGARSPIEHPSGPWLIDLALDAGATVEIADAISERALLVLEGAVRVADTVLPADHLAVLAGTAIARADLAARVLLLGGAALPPRLLDWNFVASTRERLARARDAWKARAFALIPGDDQEFVPYPEMHR